MELPISEDIIKFICWIAACRYEAKRPASVFSSAMFASVWSELTGRPLLDGVMVKSILCGRSFVVQTGYCYWSLITALKGKEQNG